MKNRIILLTALVLLGFAVTAQKKYTLNESKSKLTVDGTSTVHDWTINSTVFSGTAFFETEGDLPASITDVRFACKTDKILSDNSIMDGKTHKALMADKHPEITFVFNSLKSYTRTQDNFKGELIGTLSIAGKSKKITVPFAGNVAPSGTLQIKGAVKFKMTDFGIDPPTAMLGTLKTGDEVKINYDLQYVKSIN
jgi:polyisoprenoid-binding protein YceI